MIRTATTRNDPAEVDKYLLPKEDCVATVRRHPAVLIVPTAQAGYWELLGYDRDAWVGRSNGY